MQAIQMRKIVSGAAFGTVLAGAWCAQAWAQTVPILVTDENCHGPRVEVKDIAPGSGTLTFEITGLNSTKCLLLVDTNPDPEYLTPSVIQPGTNVPVAPDQTEGKKFSVQYNFPAGQKTCIGYQFSVTGEKNDASHVTGDVTQKICNGLAAKK